MTGAQLTGEKLIPERLAGVLARVEAGETTDEDAALLRQGLSRAARVVASLGFEDAAGTFRALFRLRAWFEELDGAPGGISHNDNTQARPETL